MSRDQSEETNCTDERDVDTDAADTDAIESPPGMSPYATGGGGVTFERKVAVQYLAHLLVGDGAIEFGEGRHAVSLAFQQAPNQPVDDLVIRIARPGELEPSGELALEVRRSPNLVSSDESAQRLVRKFVRAGTDASSEGMDHRLGLVVAGSRPHPQQLATLASLAAVQMDAPGFFNLVRTPNQFDAGTRARLDHLERLVERVLEDIGVDELDAALVQGRTWQMLSRLVVLMPRLEPPDESDWSAVGNSLISVARTPDLEGALRVRDRLLSLADEYSPQSAQVDLTILRRHVHATLDPSRRRRQEGWRTLNHLNDVALSSVRNEIVRSNGGQRGRLDRSEAANELAMTISEAPSVLVTGESGVGKSALALFSLTAAQESDPEVSQALCINLRQIPKLTVDLEAKLGYPLSTLLCELSAPQRMLVLDGADAVTEGMEDTFRYLVDCAAESDVKVVAISSIDSKQVVRDILADRLSTEVGEYVVKPLSDAELGQIATILPEIESLIGNPRSRELMRRLVVVDLLVRGNLMGVPLSDAGAMREVWVGLVRRHGRSDRGQPEARESVLLSLAEVSLNEGNRLNAINALDATAITGLRRDGLLQASVENPFIIGPDFAHDEVRRYAVARLLLADRSPAAKLAGAGAPRWTLGAAKLACQSLLEEPDDSTKPLRGRFAALQESFDGLVEAGYGTRWGDVPSEALITIADPGEVLQDASTALRANDAAGLRRLARIVSQRHRGENGFVSLAVIEPIVSLLLEDSVPWELGEYASDLLQDWLCTHVFASTPAGHPLRILLRERLVAACEDADRRLTEEREAAEAARAACTTEEVERERQFLKSYSSILHESGHNRRNTVPRECTNEVFLELLALLGPDLGDQGEAILRRVANDAPSWLAPALEESLTGFSLAKYGRGLLRELTEAYYLDDEADGEEFNDDGIREHRVRRGGFYLPLFGLHRGPFLALFQSDFPGGVSVLNRLLNHAALIRGRKLARLSRGGSSLLDMDVQPYQADLTVTGMSRVYVGDDQVWRWYRGTGVGPYPCMSALQALELTCDQLIKNHAPVETLVSMLLDGCENLAMVGLVVGILVRHLDVADTLLDSYLIEPLIWRYEFRRVVGEHSMLAASLEGIKAPERREWSLREACMVMALRATDERAAELLALGETLVERALNAIEQGTSADTSAESHGGESTEEELATVRGWASSLDRNTFRTQEIQGNLYIQSSPPEEVVEALQGGSEDLGRTNEYIRLLARYSIEARKPHAAPIEPDELKADIDTVRKLLDNLPSFGVFRPWDVLALVAAEALEAYFLRHEDLPNDVLAFAADTVLRVSEGEPPQSPYEFEETYSEERADRSAARVFPLLLVPAASELRAIVGAGHERAGFERVSAAGLHIAQAIANEVRLQLARGLDHLWSTPCRQHGPCHHEVGWEFVTQTMQGCVSNRWDHPPRRHPLQGCGPISALLRRLPIDSLFRRIGAIWNAIMHSPISADERIDQLLSDTPSELILPSRLDASIRALAPASTANICVSSRACGRLRVLIDAQRRSLLLGRHNNHDNRGSHSLVSARALLTLAGQGDYAAIHEHIDAYADSPALLRNLLCALSAAGEETPDRAAVAQRVWPSVVNQVLNLQDRGHKPFQGQTFGEMALSALLPNSAAENTYLYREVQGEPIPWWEPLSLEHEVDAWLAIAAGKGRCVDQLIGFLRILTPEDQVNVGLPWMAKAVMVSPGQVAQRSYLLAAWLIETRSAAADSSDLSKVWQNVVDALVVEGISQLAPYSE